MPGAGFQTTVKQYREIQRRFRNEPFDAAVRNTVGVFHPGCQQMFFLKFILTAQANGTYKPSFTSVSLENEADKVGQDLEGVVRDTAGQAYAGTSPLSFTRSDSNTTHYSRSRHHNFLCPDLHLGNAALSRSTAKGTSRTRSRPPSWQALTWLRRPVRLAVYHGCDEGGPSVAARDAYWYVMHP